MKVIEIKNLKQSSYPVGLNIEKNIPLFQRLASEFEMIDEFKGVDVNIFVTGSSGNIAATIFAMTVRNNCIIYSIKKPGESSHNKGCEAYINNKDSINIIIDDEIASGRTINFIYDTIQKHNRNPVERDNIYIDVLMVTGEVNAMPFMPKYLIASHVNQDLIQRFNKINGEKKPIINAPKIKISDLPQINWLDSIDMLMNAKASVVKQDAIAPLRSRDIFQQEVGRALRDGDNLERKGKDFEIKKGGGFNKSTNSTISGFFIDDADLIKKWKDQPDRVLISKPDSVTMGAEPLMGVESVQIQKPPLPPDKSERVAHMFKRWEEESKKFTTMGTDLSDCDTQDFGK